MCIPSWLVRCDIESGIKWAYIRLQDWPAPVLASNRFAAPCFRDGVPTPVACPCPPSPVCCCPIAAKICLGDTVAPTGTFASRFNGRYRISPSNWDSAIWLGGTSPFAVANIGNNTQLNGTALRFEFGYVPGTGSTSGYTWTLQGVADSTLFASLVFTNANGTFNGRNATDPFNAIHLDIIAGVAGQSVVVNGLTFQLDECACGVPVVRCGSLTDMVTTQGPPPLSQWLVADTDLSKVAWSLSGVVTIVKTTGGDESAKLDVYTKNFSPTPTITTCGGSPCPVSACARTSTVGTVWLI